MVTTKHSKAKQYSEKAAISSVQPTVFQPSVAYFCMEYGIDQSMRIYAGGLGILAGDYIKAAGKLNLPMVAIGLLYKYGYYDQIIGANGNVAVQYSQRHYNFLRDTGVRISVEVHGHHVKVAAYELPGELFGTCPLYLLSTDLPENDHLSQSITHNLYEGNQATRLAQEIVLGVGGVRVLRALDHHVDVYHFNEGHAVLAGFELVREEMEKGRTFEQAVAETRKNIVFTTHTPVKAGNEEHPIDVMLKMSCFPGGINYEQAKMIGSDPFNMTVAGLHLSRLSNAVSQLHADTARKMWHWVKGSSPIIGITNAIYKESWQDPKFASVETIEDAINRKNEMRAELVEYIREQMGILLDQDVLTICWARRFADYKRAWLIFKEKERLRKLLEAKKIQLIFAGKPHPDSRDAHELFNTIIHMSRQMPGIVTLPGYEIALSRMLKQGSDIWLNCPRRPMEASGTSGMAAGLNGTLHFSTFDGWWVEGFIPNQNGWVIGDDHVPATIEEQDEKDYQSMMHILEEEIIPMFYENREEIGRRMLMARTVSESQFTSNRMILEYYARLYSVYDT
ncbi:MAG: alpha-glucan family phosphorylase [Candidatus Caenarcaniphilales bacterium]|nr:alpha-glucan family phosphorylase [Candidatus Caenarcaniphilales bacterium]